MMLIAPPPTDRCPEWLTAFAEEMMRRKAGLPWENALSCAHIAHDASWLLDPCEAAGLWLAAINATIQQQSSHPYYPFQHQQRQQQGGFGGRFF